MRAFGVEGSEAGWVRSAVGRAAAQHRLRTAVERLGGALAIALIQAYRVVIAPQLAGACRYTPSCSRYAEEAIARFGPARGALLAVRRLGRCHPFHVGGWDPVPQVWPYAPSRQGG